jgi:hypothetical protein
LDGAGGERGRAVPDRVSLSDILVSEDLSATLGQSITLLDTIQGGPLPSVGSIYASALARDGSGRLILGFSDEAGTHLYRSIGGEISGVDEVSSSDAWEKRTAERLRGTVIGDLLVALVPDRRICRKQRRGALE